ncbi:MAG: peptidylprolyl isomerase [Caldisericia bacterium]|nr:peptidylprolyl isomerase [Caldisericia bacterium]
MGRQQKIKKLRKEGILKSTKVDKKRNSEIRKMFIWIPSIIIVIVLIFGIWAYSAKDTNATVNGVKITSAEVTEMLLPVKDNMRQQGLDPDDPEQAPNLEKYKSSIIEMLIDKALVEEFAKDNNITISEDILNERVDAEIASILSQYETQEAFEKQLAQSAIRNEANLRKEIVKSLQPSLLEDEVLKEKFGSIEISEEDARIFFNSPFAIEAQRVFIATDDTMDEATLQEKENTINELRAKIANNEMSFEKAVAEYSEDNASKVNAGKISLQEGSLVEEPEIWESVVKLNNDDLSSTVKTKKGYSIVKINNIVRNKERYNKPESAKILKIGLQAQEGATAEEKNKVLVNATGYVNTIREGKETFENIATTYSLIPDQGIAPAEVYPGSNPDTDEIVFQTLSVGDVSDPISLNNGSIEIIKLVEKNPEVIAEFSLLKDTVAKTMEDQEKARVREVFLTEIRDNAKISHSNPWQRLNSWWDQTFGGFFESFKNWIRQYTVDPLPESKTPDSTGQDGNFTIPVGDTGETITIDPEQMESMNFPVETEQTQAP